MKKFISLTIAILMVVSLAACGNQKSSSTSDSKASSDADTSSAVSESDSEDEASEEESGTNDPTGSKVLIAYFSLPETEGDAEDDSTITVDGKKLGNTEYVASLIQEATGADVFRIEAEVPYITDDHAALIEYAKDEQTNDARPAIADTIENFDDYDTVFIGYPIWWSDLPMIMYTFLESYDFSGKDVYLFSTNGGSGLAGTVGTISEKLSSANVNSDAFQLNRDDMENAPDKVTKLAQRYGLGLVTLSEGGDGIFEEYTKDMTVGEIKSDPAFGECGRLLFPMDRTVTDDMTLEDISSSSIYVWYNYIDVNETVAIVNRLKADAEAGKQIFYSIYSDDEIEADPSRADTGLFYFRGNPGEKFAVMNAGGGFLYVGAMHDSFPHALEVSRMGYNCFALIYRSDDPYTDLARALGFIHDHAAELEVDPDGYSLWGGSAGARMAATLGNADVPAQFGISDVGQAAAVIMQYTGYTSVSRSDAPTYVCVGTSDGIANWRTMKQRLETLDGYGIPTEFHSYEGLPHGFGLGTGTIAEGWINDAVAFWESNM